MKAILAILFCLIFAALSGCDNRSEQLEKQVAELQQTNSQLVQETTARDAYIDSVAQAIDEVYSSLETMKSNEQHLLKEKKELESQNKYTSKEIRQMLIGRVATINSVLKENQQTLENLQKKLSSYRNKYAGLQKMVENLKNTITEREQAIAGLTQKVQGLENEVTEKTRLVGEKDAVIGEQHKQIATAYYIVGKRDELEKKGIIAKEGGFLWGLLGSTTMLAYGLDETYFKPINKEEQKIIEVNGKIDDIIPKRSEQVYSATKMNGSQSMITIADPDRFWESKYLVIITD
ncbi:MAG: hypothetical protein HY033_13065 [Ignavibacteriae bacterium]|nr:hypothetical protein [Ignavibacteria bacterium]MBI3365822.1 hypothetical protein [Ignavibacteriota bacterium]